MRNKKAVTMRTKIIVLIVMLIAGVIALLSGLYAYVEFEQTEESMGKQALYVALAVSHMPGVKDAFGEKNPSEKIQPLAEKIREDIGAEFIVIGNADSIRYSHPDAGKIGRRMVGEDNERALEQGEAYVSKATGSLGPSIRGKAPIVDENGDIAGVVSVGFLLDDLEEEALSRLKKIALISCGAILLGVAGGTLLARDIRKDMMGLEPHEIASLYHERSAILDSVKEGIIAVDRDGVITMMNPSARRILALKEDGVNKRITDVIKGTGMNKVLETGVPEKDVEVLLEEKPVVVNRTPIFENGEVIGAVASFRDKTEINEMLNTLSEVRRYSEDLRAQTHEFTNKLYVLSGMMQLGQYDEAVRMIQEESGAHDQQNHILFEQIRDSSLQAVLLGKLAKASEKKVSFTIDDSSAVEPLPERMTVTHLITIMGNLIDNALEATEGMADRRISFFVTDIGNDIIFEVEDNGGGILPKDEQRIFDKGFSTKEKDGRGYGLALVSQAVGELGGSIEMKTGEAGTIFTVFLPKSIEDEGE